MRLELRCGQAPIMERVGARAKLPREQRVCRMCAAGAVESAEHLLCHCPAYDGLRQDCLARVAKMVAQANAPKFKRALQNCEMRLFLCDRLLMELGPELRWSVDAVLCNYLKVLWRKREEVWLPQCVDRDPWRPR